MSVGLYKYDGDIYHDAKEILSENIASQRIYEKYLKPAIKELNIYYFQDGGEIKKENLDSVIVELESLIKWVKDNVEGSERGYLIRNLENSKKVILESAKQDGVFYIF